MLLALAAPAGDRGDMPFSLSGTLRTKTYLATASLILRRCCLRWAFATHADFAISKAHGCNQYSRLLAAGTHLHVRWGSPALFAALPPRSLSNVPHVHPHHCCCRCLAAKQREPGMAWGPLTRAPAVHAAAANSAWKSGPPLLQRCLLLSLVALPELSLCLCCC